MTTVQLAHYRDQLDEALGRYCEKRRADAETVDPAYGALWDDITSAVLAGGKRLRPGMVVLTYQAYGGNEIEAIMPVAMSQELVHCAMLVHDDIIDRDLVRRGLDNISGRSLKRYAQHVEDAGDRRHYADSSALLAGDVLISESYQLINTSLVSSQQRLDATELLGRSIFEVVGGELIDTEAAFLPNRPGQPEQIAYRKTAVYSFVIPLIMGAKLAGADSSQIALLEKLGAEIGIGFQLVDDIIGSFGDEAVSGKSADGDIREGKYTLLVEAAANRLSPQEQAEFDSLYGNSSLDAVGIVRTRELIEACGARRAVELRVDSCRSSAEQTIRELAVSDDYKQSLLSIVEHSLNRDF